MNPTTRRRLKMLAIPLAATLVLGACSSSDEEADTDTGDGETAGVVNVSGSSTVAPISTRVADLFEESGAEATVNVDGPGTGDGFVVFCEGDADITGASRPIKEEELAACEDAGIEFIELEVAIDGLAVLTNPANSVECLSFADMYALVGPESQGFETWADAQDLANALGSDTEFPDAPLDITGPGEESGTYDSFVELVIESAGEARVESGDVTEDDITQTQPDYQSSGDDNVIIQNIVGSDSSFGWVGLSFALEAGDSVKLLSVSEEPNGDCVTPTEETVADGSYPIARPLFIYVNAESAESNQSVADYVDFYLSAEGIAAVSEVKYVQLTDETLAATSTVWENRETGTREG